MNNELLAEKLKKIIKILDESEYSDFSFQIYSGIRNDRLFKYSTNPDFWDEDNMILEYDMSNNEVGRISAYNFVKYLDSEGEVFVNNYVNNLLEYV